MGWEITGLVPIGRGTEAVNNFKRCQQINSVEREVSSARAEETGIT